MRYAPHNQLLKKLLREDHAVGSEALCLLSILRMWASGILLIFMFGKLPFPSCIWSQNNHNQRQRTGASHPPQERRYSPSPATIWIFFSGRSLSLTFQFQDSTRPTMQSSVASYGSLNVLEKSENPAQQGRQPAVCLVLLKDNVIFRAGQQTWRCRRSKFCSMRGASRLPAMLSTVV